MAENELTLEQIQGMVAKSTADAVTAALAAQEAAAKAARDAQEAEALKARAAKADELAKEIEDLKAKAAKVEEERQQPDKRLPGNTREEDPAGVKTDQKPVITVGSRFDSLSALDLAWGVELMRNKSMSRRDEPLKPSEQYANALAAKAWQEGFRPVKRDGSFYKSDELSYSTQASYGDEWVPDLWSSELWRKARLDNVVLPLFRQIEMPSDPYELPIEGTDPTVYYVPETTDESQLLISGSGAAMPDSKVGSGKVQLDAKKLAVRVGFSAELTEDSIVPVLSIFREQAMRAMMDAVDNVLLNGDTTDNYSTAENINNEGADPANTSKYLAFDGIRHLWLVTTTGNGVNANGAPTLDLIRQARFTMTNKYAINPRNLALVTDASTYAKLLGLNEVVTNDKFGPSFTAMTGQIGVLDGMPVLVSAEQSLTYTDGFVHNTGSNNTKGQISIVYRPGWVVGFRRRIATAVEYISFYDAYQMTCTMRLAFNKFDSEVAAGVYNITV